MSATRKQSANKRRRTPEPARDLFDDPPFDLPSAATDVDEQGASQPPSTPPDDSEPPFDLPPIEAYQTESGPEAHGEQGDAGGFDGDAAAPLDFVEAFEPAPPPPTSRSISQRASVPGRPGGVPTPGLGVEVQDLDGLNAEQREAVETLSGPVLVLAGAGTGKTRVLTTRIAHILATGAAYPSQILAVTFTNKAAREMKERIGGLVGGAVEGMPWLGTFHAIGVRLLRRHAELAGLKSGFTILDMDDQLRLVKQVIEASGLDKDRWPARQFAALLDSWKNRGLTPAKVPAGEAASFGGGKGKELYAAYQKRLKELNACDFGDLLLESLHVLMENPDILADYHRRFRYILVDEYQDTNVAQHMWLRLLAEGSPNVCCVGDDDQSIYGWRGAEVDNILRFEEDFPGAKVIRLERNYRSTGHILAAASGLISANEGRLGKTLFTDGEPGDKPTISGHWDDEEEARTIAEAIETLQRERHPLNEIAVLVRASFQMRVLEDRFITTGLPYRVIGGPRFYERAEIKDAIAYLEVVANPSNDLKFERIINVPKRGIGDTSVKRVRELARSRDLPLFAGAQMIVETEDISGKARRSLTALLRSFERWCGQVDTMRHTELAELILDESGYTAMWQSDKSPQAQSRLDNLKELVRFMHEFETLAGFLEHVSLVMDVDQANDGDRVSLMTLHAAKGLEFDTVFLPGWEEGLFPSQRTLDESGMSGLEEERRLAYVGMTRAKRQAKVSFAQNRRTRGLYQSAIPSRFVDELPEDHVEVIEATSPFSGAYRNFDQFGGGYGRSPYGQSRFDATTEEAQTSSYDTPGWQPAQKKWSNDKIAQDRAAAASRARKSGPKTIEGELVASSSEQSTFKEGERVFHQKFGYGRIREVDGNKLTIDFEKSGQKRVVDSFVERH